MARTAIVPVVQLLKLKTPLGRCCVSTANLTNVPLGAIVSRTVAFPWLRSCQDPASSGRMPLSAEGAAVDFSLTEQFGILLASADGSTLVVTIGALIEVSVEIERPDGGKSALGASLEQAMSPRSTSVAEKLTPIRMPCRPRWITQYVDLDRTASPSLGRLEPAVQVRRLKMS